MKKKWKAAVAGVLAAVLLAGCGSAATGGTTSGGAASESTGTSGSTAASGSASSATQETAEAPELQVGVIKALGTVAPYVSEDLGFYDDTKVNLTLTEFSDGSALMEAFAAGEIDVAICGIGPIANWYTKGIDVQVIAAANGGGHVIVTRNDTGIRSVEDLAGHSIAEPNPGTVTDTLLRSYILKNAGLDPETDVTLVPGMKPADMAIALFDTQEVDAILTWEPFVAQAEETYGDDLVIVYDSPNELKADFGEDTFYAVNVVAASGDAIAQKEDALAAFLSGYEEGVTYLNNEADANAEIAKLLELDEAVVERARTRIDYNYELNKESLSRTLGWAKDAGYIDELPDENEFYTEIKGE